MEVILLEKINKRGTVGEIIDVKPGFARNYLIPQKKALRATEQNKKYYEAKKKELEAENKKKIEAASKLVSQLDGKFVTLIRQASGDGRLFGSVNSRDIVEVLLDETKIEISRSQIILGHAVKSLGIYEVMIQLHPEVSAKIMVNVAKNEDEAIEAKKNFINPPQKQSENNVVKG